MLYFILVLKEVALVIALLAIVALVIYTVIMDQNKRTEHNKRLDGLAERLLAKADDENPIMLNVSQERLIEKVADEIERRRL